jgi:hypothetical protein
LANADYSAQIELNCSGDSDNCKDLDSARPLLRIKLVKTDGSDFGSTDENTVGCVNKLLHTLYISLSVSLNGKPIILHETIITKRILKTF